MKPKHKMVSLSLPPSRLYLNDLYEIESLFKKHCDSYLIDTPNCEYANIDELINNQVTRTDTMTIKGKNPDIDLKFSKYDANISAYTVDDKLNSFSYLLKDRLMAKSNILLRIFTGSLWSLVTYIIGFTIVFITIRDLKISMMITAILLLSYFFNLYIIQGIFRFPKYNIIRFYKRCDRPGFIIRNKDKLILMLLGSLIGAAFTILFEYIFTKSK